MWFHESSFYQSGFHCIATESFEIIYSHGILWNHSGNGSPSWKTMIPLACIVNTEIDDIFGTQGPGHLQPCNWPCSLGIMMTSSNGNIFCVTGPFCGEFTGPGEFQTQRPVTRNFDVFFDLRLNKRLSKQPWGLWFEEPSWSLWRQCNVLRLQHQKGIARHELITEDISLKLGLTKRAF